MVTVDGSFAEFSFFRPEANAVYVVGDFNDWRTDQSRMTRVEGGYWRAKIKLQPGQFKFRYCADGVWYTDYAAFGVEPGPFGMDSVLSVSEPALTISEPLPAATAAA